MFIKQLISVPEEDLELRARLQNVIENTDSEDFRVVLAALGEDYDIVAEFIGEGVRRNGPGRYCMARRGGADFKGACSDKNGEVKADLLLTTSAKQELLSESYSLQLELRRART